MGSNVKEYYMKKTCVIWTIGKEELQTILNESSTIKEVIHKIGMNMPVQQGMNYRRMKQRIKEDNLDLTRFNENYSKHRKKLSKLCGRKSKKPDENCFCENSSCERGSLKGRILENNLLPNKCSLCGISSIWNGKPLSLELDHINQINNDNRIENLRFLCPNCHSQITNEHRRKNRISKFNNCKCGKLKNRVSIQCRSCAVAGVAGFTRRFNPSKDELINTITEKDYNICAVAKIYGVSDNSIRKRCKLLGISYKK